jgi:hypothetical protein
MHRSKHLALKVAYVQEAVSRGTIRISSQENVADILTKVLPPVSFERLRLHIVATTEPSDRSKRCDATT